MQETLHILGHQMEKLNINMEREGRDNSRVLSRVIEVSDMSVSSIMKGPVAGESNLPSTNKDQD